DDVHGAFIDDSIIGTPFDCSLLLDNNYANAQLVASLHFLHMPDVPAQPNEPGFHDVIVSMLFEGADGAPCVANCPAPCTADADCDDGESCNGHETCGLDGFCKRGVDPIVCSDGDACNGLETCSGGTCQPGTPPTCDDGNACNGIETCVSPGGCAV